MRDDRVFEPDFDDGFLVSAPVGTYRPNDFGLFDTHGNVWEWCRDSYARYREPVAPGDGLRQNGDANVRVYRGGAWSKAATFASCAMRNGTTPGGAGDSLGCRPARSLGAEADRR